MSRYPEVSLSDNGRGLDVLGHKLADWVACLVAGGWLANWLADWYGVQRSIVVGS